MADVQHFDVSKYVKAKAAAIPVTATTEGAPQTLVTFTTGVLAAGVYSVGYSFQVTHAAKSRTFFFRVGEDSFPDARFFTETAGDSDSLNKNRAYNYPVDFPGGIVTLSLECYEPTATVIVDFVDIMLHRVG